MATEQSKSTGVLDEIAPKTSRGAYKIGTFLNVICLPDNDCAGVSEDYQRLAIVKIGSTNEYRYVDVLYHLPGCQSEAKSGPRTP